MGSEEGRGEERGVGSKGAGNSSTCVWRGLGFSVEDVCKYTANVFPHKCNNPPLINNHHTNNQPLRYVYKHVLCFLIETDSNTISL